MSDPTEAQMDEYRAAQDMPVDDKNRPAVHILTDRAIAEETLVLLRAFGDALQEVGNNPMFKAVMGNNPMLKAMMR